MANYSHVKRGVAPDLNDGNHYRSGWERDVARFLNHMHVNGILDGWAYEPQLFTFQGIGYKRGPFSFLPDFALRYNESLPTRQRKALEVIFDEVHPGKTVFLEVKGQETGKDRNKWKRFRKHSGYELEVVKRDKLRMIQDLYSFNIPFWESKVL